MSPIDHAAAGLACDGQSAGIRNQWRCTHLILRCSKGPAVLARNVDHSTSAGVPHSGHAMITNSLGTGLKASCCSLIAHLLTTVVSLRHANRSRAMVGVIHASCGRQARGTAAS
jgi:hypothetical protein